MAARSTTWLEPAEDTADKRVGVTLDHVKRSSIPPERGYCGLRYGLSITSGRLFQIIRIVEGKKSEIKAALTDFVLPRDTIVVPQRFF